MPRHRPHPPPIVGTWEIFGHVSLVAAIEQAAALARARLNDQRAPLYIGIIARPDPRNGDFGVSKARLVETIAGGHGTAFDLELLP